MDLVNSELVARHRKTEIDAAYEAYDRHPLDEPDEWGDLASFLAASRLRKQAMQPGRAPDHDEVVGPLPNPECCLCDSQLPLTGNPTGMS